ncbi:MAG: hypothetical protein COA93_05310 [Alphaproteobacteria bacterium]|nr:MAG: hypothetical protein COA93_05310 [Alphaproteobacteria bacterium]
MTALDKEFDFSRPKTIEQLYNLVQECQHEGRHFVFSAGGTDIMLHLKSEILSPDIVISLTGLPALNTIEKRGNHIIIGALTSLSDLSKNNHIQEHLPSLGGAARKVASPQIRNRATIGGNIMVENRCSYINQSRLNRQSHSPCFKADGNICHLVKSVKRGDDILCQARFVSDTAPILLLQGSTLDIIGPAGPREIKLADLYLNDGMESKSLMRGEIITHIKVEIPENSASHYEKLTIRNALDFPALGVAVLRRGNGDISVALTGLNTRPGVFHATLENYETHDDMIVDICQKANDFTVTYQQDFFPRGYRKNMISVFIRRGINKILEGGKS